MVKTTVFKSVMLILISLIYNFVYYYCYFFYRKHFWHYAFNHNRLNSFKFSKISKVKKVSVKNYCSESNINNFLVHLQNYRLNLCCIGFLSLNTNCPTSCCQNIMYYVPCIMHVSYDMSIEQGFLNTL